MYLSLVTAHISLLKKRKINKKKKIKKLKKICFHSIIICVIFVFILVLPVL